MKKIISVILVAIIIILGIFIIKGRIYNKFDYEIEKITKYNYYIYKENEKYGVIDKEGKIIIEANYSKIVIPNPRKRPLYLLQWRQKYSPKLIRRTTF